ncbi:hypothetical protein SAY87_032017 [Trapa incisa]|uniref:Uncharacterized protein n=1 Tax=Trapa incisa TaxID=236973 RepID=A0AAN7QQA6_9MYRT|nr:hypothetical protein SAY87_032017 [Trapa incisa]
MDKHGAMGWVGLGWVGHGGIGPLCHGGIPLSECGQLTMPVVSCLCLSTVGSATLQLYSYECTEGALKIPCHVPVFERVLEGLWLGAELHDLQDLIAGLFIDDPLP